MKNKLKRIIPERLLILIRKFRGRKQLDKLNKFDSNRHKRYAYGLNDEWTLNNLRSKMTLHYHSIEKGLSNPEFRLGFGEKAFKELFFSMDKFLELNYPTDDSRFQHSVSVIKQYVLLHNDEKFSVDYVESKFNEYKKYLIDEFTDVGGFITKEIDQVPQYNNLNFQDLANSRYSVRDYGIEPINDNKVFDSIQIATKTPSVCNRQAYKVYRIKNKELIEKTFKMQGGLTTHGENLQEMLLVTCNREFMIGAQERNQTYIDGGMFLMSLVYALTYNQIASCVLNTNFSLKKEKLFRDLLGISYSEDLIAFVSIGSFKQKNLYTKSPRDTYKDITVVLN